MAPPQPQTISNQLLDTLERLFAGAEAPDEFTLRRLDKEAEKLVRVDAAAGYTAKAGVAALRYDQEATLANTECASRVARTVPEVLHNGGVNLRHVGLYAQALDYLRRAWEWAPGETRFAAAFTSALHEFGRPQEAERVILSARERGALIDETELDQVRKEVGYLHEMNMPPDRLAREVGLAYEVLAQHRLTPRTTDVEGAIDPETGKRYMVFRMGVACDLERALDLEGELAQLLGEQDDWDPVSLSMEYAPLADPSHERRAA